MISIPVLSVVGLNIEEHKKDFIKKLMLDVMNNKDLVVTTSILPDPINPFDSNAIKVQINNFDVGFIGKNDQYYFDFTKYNYTANIVSWGIVKDGSTYVYIQPCVI